MSWKTFIETLGAMAFGITVSLTFAACLFLVALGLERVWQALILAKWKAKNTSTVLRPPSPQRGEGDDDDGIDGGVGGAPACP